VPAARRGPEPRRLPGEDQEGELEGLGQADVLELNGGGSSGEEVAVVERVRLEGALTQEGLTKRVKPEG
jgi:hypothetical protein